MNSQLLVVSPSQQVILRGAKIYSMKTDMYHDVDIKFLLHKFKAKIFLIHEYLNTSGF